MMSSVLNPNFSENIPRGVARKLRGRGHVMGGKPRMRVEEGDLCQFVKTVEPIQYYFTFVPMRFRPSCSSSKSMTSSFIILLWTVDIFFTILLYMYSFV